jgi:hypothetical protein
MGRRAAGNDDPGGAHGDHDCGSAGPTLDHVGVQRIWTITGDSINGLNGLQARPIC